MWLSILDLLLGWKYIKELPRIIFNSVLFMLLKKQIVTKLSHVSEGLIFLLAHVSYYFFFFFLSFILFFWYNNFLVWKEIKMFNFTTVTKKTYWRNLENSALKLDGIFLKQNDKDDITKEWNLDEIKWNFFESKSVHRNFMLCVC